MAQFGNGGRTLFQLGDGNGTYVRSVLEALKGLAVGIGQMAEQLRMAQFGITQCHAEGKMGGVVDAVIQLRAVLQSAYYSLPGAFDVGVFGCVFGLEAGERVGFDGLIEQGVGVAGYSVLHGCFDRVVEQKVQYRQAAVDDGAFVGDEGGDLGEGVDGSEFGRRDPRVGVIQLQAVPAFSQCGQQNDAGVGGGVAGVEFHGRPLLGLEICLQFSGG